MQCDILLSSVEESAEVELSTLQFSVTTMKVDSGGRNVGHRFPSAKLNESGVNLKMNILRAAR